MSLRKQPATDEGGTKSASDVIFRSEALLSVGKSHLILIDLQEKFLGAIARMEEVVKRSRILVQAAARLGVPVSITEQYPKALGATVAELRGVLPSDHFSFDKMCFSATGNDRFHDHAIALGARQFVLAGVETHVCVLQTALDLMNLPGVRVFVVVDAVASRNDADRDLALRRLENEGATLVSTEMVLFEWLQRAGTAEFKELQKLIL